MDQFSLCFRISLRTVYKLSLIHICNLTEVGTGSAEWKLTLKDTSRSFSASASSTLVRVGENLTVTYSGAGTGKNEYVSAMLADNSGNILYYGRIAQNSANGTASVEIPSDLTAGTYTLKAVSYTHLDVYKRQVLW